MVPALQNGNPDNMHWHTYRHVIDLLGRECIQRVHDGAWIPTTEDNGDYRRYLRFAANGNIPEEIDLRTETGKQRFKECDIEASKYHQMRKTANEEAAKRAAERVALERSVNNG